MIFNESQGIMMDVERAQGGQEVEDELIIFAGEALGLISGGRVRASVHYVDESFSGQARHSFPFFLRPRPEADLSPWISSSSSIQPLIGEQDGPFTYAMFIERVMWRDRAWSQISFPGAASSLSCGSDY